ncbi:MAG: hypothetical protein IJS17_07260 [Clostridia bacterium]|nr:hypothetical protein [Clostridia bacterium]
MTEEEYLLSRIRNINKNLSKPFLSKKKRINQTTALRFYRNELEKTRALKNEDVF